MAKKHDDDFLDDQDFSSVDLDEDVLEEDDAVDALEEEGFEELEEEKEDQDEEEEKKEKPKPQNTLLTILLCFLNILAVCGFAILLVINYQGRYQWSEAVFLHDLALQGLPLEEENQKITAAQELQPLMQIDPDQFKTEYVKRRTGVSVTEKFQAFEGSLTQRIQPKHLNDSLLKKAFGTTGPPVKTLEEEVKRVRGELFPQIDKVVEELEKQATTEEGKRLMITQLIQP